MQNSLYAYNLVTGHISHLITLIQKESDKFVTFCPLIPTDFSSQKIFSSTSRLIFVLWSESAVVRIGMARLGMVRIGCGPNRQWSEWAWTELAFSRGPNW